MATMKSMTLHHVTSADDACAPRIPVNAVAATAEMISAPTPCP
jgi:hypothetical protein